MASGDIYELVDAQTMEGQEILNVYYYRQAAPALVGNIPEQLADAYEGQVLADVAHIQTPQLLHRELRVKNLFNVAENHTSVISEPGTWTTSLDTEATFDAVGFRLVQDNGAVRNGAKRFGGIPEDADTNGIVTDTAFITALLAAGAALILGLDSGIVTNAFLPVIVKRILDGTIYRLPENSGEAVYGNVTDALYNANTTSQVSRKIGRGE